MNQDLLALDNFGGTVRLFPLPNLVLFPRVAQPLHVFEPRYRQLTADVLADDRLIGMALLRPGWEADYHNNPPLFPVVCIGRVLEDERLADGRYNLLLHGIRRARILEELTTDKPYRTVRVELLSDVPVDGPEEEDRLRKTLGEAVLPFFSAHPPAMAQFRQLLESPMTLEGLCDLFCFAMPLEPEQKQELLEEDRVEARIRLLMRRLEGVTPPTPKTTNRQYPPTFSDN